MIESYNDLFEVKMLGCLMKCPMAQVNKSRDTQVYCPRSLCCIPLAVQSFIPCRLVFQVLLELLHDPVHCIAKVTQCLIPCFLSLGRAFAIAKKGCA